MELKWFSRPDKEKYTNRRTCAFSLLPLVRTYPLNNLLNSFEQFCHPLLNELDHCALQALYRRVESAPNSKLSRFFASIELALYYQDKLWQFSYFYPGPFVKSRDLYCVSKESSVFIHNYCLVKLRTSKTFKAFTRIHLITSLFFLE